MWQQTLCVWGVSAGNAFFHSQITTFVRHSQQINVTGPELQGQKGWVQITADGDESFINWGGVSRLRS